MSEEKKSHKRRKFGAEEEHEHAMVHDESNWLVSYADLMTLLFGFFVIMYSISKIDQTKYTVVAKDMAKYFGGKVDLINEQNQAKINIEGVLKKALSEGTYQVASSPSGISIKFNSNILFAPGSAKLNPDMYSVLTKLIEILLPYKTIDMIHFEGHTDDEAINSPYFPTNWELSAARATRILRQFESSGFKSEKLIAEGFGSSRPELPNRDDKGQSIIANQKINRRVVINLDMSIKSKQAIQDLSAKNFKVQESPEEQALPVESKDESAMDTEESLRNRMEMAQEKLKTVNEKIKDLTLKQKKRQSVLEMEKKVKELERKAKEAEDKLVEPLPKK